MKAAILKILVFGILLGCVKRRTNNPEPANTPIVPTTPGEEDKWCGKDFLECPEFSKGELLVGFKAAATTRHVFDLLNQGNIKVANAKEAHYHSTIAPDSLAYIKSIINSKTYITPHATKEVVYLDKERKVLVDVVLDWGLTKAQQEDWLTTEKVLKLVGRPFPSYFLLKVPPGEEHKYGTDLLKNERVCYVRYNCPA